MHSLIIRLVNMCHGDRSPNSPKSDSESAADTCRDMY